MDRDTLQKLALGNRVDLAAVLHVEAALETLRRAGVVQPSGYAITPPLGRMGVALGTRELENRPTPCAAIDDYKEPT